MSSKGDLLQTLRVHGREYGFELSDEQLDLFRIYMNELMIWNEKMNLTGLRTPERIMIELFLDSLIPARRISPEGCLLDVGSGAGFPGLPLKILYPRLEVHLLESREKRVSFLKQVVRILDLSGIDVILGRIETKTLRLPLDCYHLITARALARFSQSVRWCAPRLCRGGVLISYLGVTAGELVSESRPLLEEEGLVLQEVIPYSLPGKKDRRHAVILRRKEWNPED